MIHFTFFVRIALAALLYNSYHLASFLLASKRGEGLLLKQEK
jgi:hypothetical protein